MFGLFRRNRDPWVGKKFQPKHIYVPGEIWTVEQKLYTGRYLVGVNYGNGYRDHFICGEAFLKEQTE